MFKDMIKKNLLFFGVLFIVIFLAYGCTMFFQFVYDDEVLVQKNCYIKTVAFFPSIFSSDTFAFAQYGGSGYYRPLQMVSYAIDYMFYGLDPQGFHITNLFLFLLCIFALFLFLKQVLENDEIAVVISLVFSLSPFLMPNVAYVSGRGDLLLYLFTFSGLYCAARYFKENVERYGVFAACFFLLSLFSKGNAVLFPLFLLVTYGSVKKKIRPLQSVLFFISMAVITFFFLINRFLYHEEFARLFCNGSGNGLVGSFIAAIMVFFEYLKILFFPKDLYFFRIVGDGQIVQWYICLFWTLMLMGFIGLIIASFIKKKRIVFFGLTWTFFSFLPFMKYVNIYSDQGISMLEHWFGFTALGIYILIIYSLYNLFRQKHILRFLMWGMLIVYYAFFIQQNIGMWQNNYTLMTKTSEFYEKNKDANLVVSNNQGVLALQNGDLDEAEMIFSRLMEKDSLNIDVVVNMAEVLSMKGEYEKAEKIIKKYPELNALLYYWLGQIYLAQEKNVEAYKSFMNAIEKKPEHVESWIMLGEMSYNVKNYDAALKYYNHVLRLDPDTLYLDFMLANTYFQLGDMEKAVYWFKEAYKEAPNDRRTIEFYRKLQKKTDVLS